MLSFLIAIKHGYGDRQGKNWVNCSLFGRRAEGKLREYLTRGAQICVSGEISLEEYQGRDGTTKTALKLNVRDLDLVGGKQSNRNRNPDNRPAQAPSQTSQDSSYEDDLPFQEVMEKWLIKQHAATS